MSYCFIRVGLIGTLAMLEKFKRFLADSSGQMGGRDLPGVAIMVIIAGVVLFVGIQIMSQVIGQMDLQSGDPLYNASESLTDSFNQAFGTFGLAITIVIFAVIIVYLYALRGRR